VKNKTKIPQVQNQITKAYEKSKSISLTHKYMIVHFPGLVQLYFNKKWWSLTSYTGPNLRS